MASQLPLVVIFGGCFFAGFNRLLTDLTSKTVSKAIGLKIVILRIIA